MAKQSDVFQAVVTSDWHLDKYMSPSLRPHFQNRRDIDVQISEIEKPFEYAIQNGVRTVFVAGDIGDRHVLSTEAHAALLGILLKYDGVLDIHIILGNHDVSDVHTNSLSLIYLLAKYHRFKSVWLYQERTSIEIEGIPFNMLPFPYVEAERGDTAVNVCHVESVGAVRDNGVVINTGVDFNIGDQYWISGHLHKYQRQENGVFCGSPYQLTFGETPHCGWLHFKARTTSGVLETRHKHVKGRPAVLFHNVRVNCRDDWEQIDCPSHLYKVTVGKTVVPSDIRTRFPNIVSIVGEDDRVVQQFIERQDVPELDLNTGLSDFLTGDGLTRKQVQRGLRLVELARGTTGESEDG